MSAVPAKRVVVAHPSALRHHGVTSVKTDVMPVHTGILAGPQGLDSRLRGNDWWRGNDALRRVVAMALGVALFVALWALIAKFGRIPDPQAVFREAVKIFADPFYRNGPNDQGIGWNILYSLERVAVGFGLAALAGIPLGFTIGRFAFVGRMVNPLISLLRPVSPLAWLPIGLLVFKAANPAAVWTIFICSIWPMVINTAVGVQRVPQDYLNVARVLQLSEWKVMTRILLPAVLPYMLTGLRLGLAQAWRALVGVEDDTRGGVLDLGLKLTRGGGEASFDRHLGHRVELGPGAAEVVGDEHAFAVPGHERVDGPEQHSGRQHRR